MRRAVIAYVPVLHRGYLEFFLNHPDAVILYLLGKDVVSALASEYPELSYLEKKDALRAIPASTMRDMVDALGIFADIKVLHGENLDVALEAFDAAIMPDEDVSRRFFQKYLIGKKHAVYHSVFLRWHRGNVEREEEIIPDRSITVTDFDRECMARAIQEGEKSADWWRQVGGVIVKDGAPLLWTHNVHVPFPEMPVVYGDPRSMWSKGVRIELSTAEHVESVLVAEAASRGLALRGTDLYLTDFPCPPCAKLIARAGFRRLYYAKGSYAMLQGESIVRSNGAEIVRVII